jgi:hypothetical protein
VACRDRAGDFLRDTGGGVLRGTTGDSHTFIISAIGDGVAVSPARLCLVCSHPGRARPTVCFVQSCKLHLSCANFICFKMSATVLHASIPQMVSMVKLVMGEGSDPRKIHVVDRPEIE